MKATISRGNLASMAMLVSAALCVAMHEQPAEACGGCFHPPPQPAEVESVITDHRMVFSISTTQTVLWDQVRYSGDPGEFAWVLPIHPGARIELSRDAWLAALDASTQTVITGPSRTCNNGAVNYGSSGGGGGGCGSSSVTDESFAAPTLPGDGTADGGFESDTTVTVVSQNVIGPYETVTLHSANGEALDTWLVNNGFDIPVSVRPTIDAYAAEAFDFIALKMRPGAGIRAMQPVRIITAGADPTLPLRMVAAGIGAHVGLTLYVISEGRYHTESFPDAQVDFSKLTWDPKAGRSNFQELTTAALQAGKGTGWLTEYADMPAVTSSSYVPPGQNPGLYSAYFSSCTNQPSINAPCVVPDGGSITLDAGAPDANDAASANDAGSANDASDADPSDASDSGGDADGDADAVPDAGSDVPPAEGDDAGCFMPQDACTSYDDLDLALNGLHQDNVFLTRLRAYLPANALSAGDLRIGASSSQSTVSNLHSTNVFSDPTFDPCAGLGGSNVQPNHTSSSDGCICATPRSTRNQLGTYFAFAAAGLLGLTLVRRRRR